jgi:hypothetical protein
MTLNMSNAKEKAIELVNKMYGVTDYQAKQSALIAVDEILDIDNIKPYILHKEIIKFYQEVKKEIEKL